MSAGEITAALAVAAALGLVIYLIVDHRRLAEHRAGRVLVFLGLLPVPVGAAALGTGQGLRRATETRFCLSCHEMEPYGRSLMVDDREPLPAVHFQNHLVNPKAACYTCHRDYALFGDLRTKVAGLRHVWAHYTRQVPERIQLYKPYSNANCLHCHAGARRFEESKAHETRDVKLADMKSGKVSCLVAGCHAVAHDIGGLPDADFWRVATEVKGGGR